MPIPLPSLSWFLGLRNSNSGRLVQSHLGLSCALLIETNTFTKLVVILKTSQFEHPNLLSRFYFRHIAARSRIYPIVEIVVARPGFEQEYHVHVLHNQAVPQWYGSSVGRVVKLLACGARGPGFDSRPRHLNFQKLVISCFQVEIWLKDRH